MVDVENGIGVKTPQKFLWKPFFDVAETTQNQAFPLWVVFGQHWPSWGHLEIKPEAGNRKMEAVEWELLQIFQT